MSHEKLVFQSNAHARARTIIKINMRALDNGAHADHYCDYTWLQNKTNETQQAFFCGNTGLCAEVQGSLVNVT